MYLKGVTDSMLYVSCFAMDNRFFLKEKLKQTGGMESEDVTENV